MADDPEKDEESSPEEEGGEDQPNDLPPRPDPKRLDRIEFAVKDLWQRSPLVVTVADGPITAAYGPAELIGKLAERIAALIRDVAGTPTMLYGIAPGNSMTMFFGDPQPSGSQQQLEFEVTLDAAKRVADLLEADEETFVARAIGIGAPMSRYDDLAQLVQSEGFQLKWEPRTQPARVLTPERAGEQHVRLQAPPETHDWEQRINGILYRVIAEPGEEQGTAGIRRFKWSPAPGGVPRAKIIASADREMLDRALEEGLFGDAVQAVLRIKRGVLGMTIDPDYIDLEWVSIEPGPSEESRLGRSIEDLLGELDQDEG
ncbi:MAG TPA: hypothetical protein VJU14_11085 [Solirubrobacterales bacterium]|nr:hypothetical protein [Solirubrobacterales bacterium]